MILPTSVIFLIVATFAAYSDSAQQDGPIAKTPLGKLRGIYETSRNGNRFESYLGIRYGNVKQRFDASTRADGWGSDIVKDATNFGPHCAQITLGKTPVSGVEDCLYLNVFTPKADGTKRPVLVYLHGGGYTIGSTLEYGGAFLVDEDIVLVVVSYRLGILGFLNTDDGALSGNNGLKDQVLALKWIQENIDAFGGDKNRVTISGNSAGCGSVQYLMISPMAQGLFHGAYCQSGSPLNPAHFTENFMPTTLHFGEQLNCGTENSVEIVSCLRLASLESLMLAQKTLAKWYFDNFRLAPSIEVKSSLNPEPFLEKSPEQLIREGDFAKVPLLHTTVPAEGGIFASHLIRNDAVLKELNDHSSTIDPITFQYEKFPALMSRKTEVSKAMRQFYFGGQTIEKAHEENLVDLYSDIWFMPGILKSAKLFSQHLPVYLGLFTYKRSDDYSPVLAVGVSDKVPYVSHSEDLSYMFSHTGNTNVRPFSDVGELKHENDIKFSKKFVQMIADFVKTGKLVVPFGNTPIEGVPVTTEEADTDSFKFLVLGNEPYLEENPFRERMNFWEQQHLLGKISSRDEL